MIDTKNRNLIELCSKIECTGCSACLNVCPSGAIKFKRDIEGFDYPEINHDLCIKCNLCRKVCPVISPLQFFTFQKPEVYAAWNLDLEIRKKSSSGGLFSALAEYIINQGGVVFGASFDEKLNLNHTKAENNYDYASMRSSKYLQSKIGNTFKQVRSELLNKRKVLYVGTPCQIGGLKSYLRKEYNELITCDLVCHGVPSPGVFKRYIELLERKYNANKINSYSFRETEGWGCKTSIITDKAKKELFGYENFYQNAFLKSYLHRECCYSCSYAKIQRCGDITIGDFWGLGITTPFSGDTRNGVSLVLCNTDKGKDVFNELSDYIFAENRDIEEATMLNSNLMHPDKRPVERNTIYVDFYSLSLKDLAQKYNLMEKKSFLNYVKRIIKKLLLISRIKYQ